MQGMSSSSLGAAGHRPTDEAYLYLDGAWASQQVVTRRIDAGEWGPRLRFSTPASLIEEFFRAIELDSPRFTLFGSGDFHHLTALWLRAMPEPFTLVSFDNHPDWDVRPPKWSCGAWVNRALELSHVEKISIWGCGNFECWWPGQFFGNRRAERRGRLEVHPWADDRAPRDRKRPGAILRADWQDKFGRFVQSIAGRPIYVTIDLDCLVREEAVTNWENGRLTTDDLVWAIQQLRSSSDLIAGDVCGAFSEPHYARRKQRLAATFDHPKLVLPAPDQIQDINLTALAKIWPALVGR